MNPVYLDLHIHTSDDPTKLNPSYSIDTLISNIKKVNKDSDFLISLTDHNTINKTAYLNAVQKGINIILGVELHIQNYEECPAYHCHIYFNVESITASVIDDLNTKLDMLYPIKVVAKQDKSIPKIEKIVNTFDSYDFLLLPHGGQSHATFDTSIPSGVKFDTTLERSIYYNQFDGFTARGDNGLERTQEYFKRLGINDFVNLVTCTDNYNPQKYPNPKVDDSNPFTPTWMFARPTFEGLRLSLSESSRLVYSENKPTIWSENIKKVSLSKDNIEIDVELTSGLNVVIGGSSSGKTLFVDSIYNSITKNFSGSKYTAYEVDKMTVENPSGTHPHYLSQNYIMSVVSDATDDNLENIELIKKVFPGDDQIREKIDIGLKKLKESLRELIKCVQTIDEEQKNLNKIPNLSRLILKGDVQGNIIEKLLPSEKEKNRINYSEHKFNDHIEKLDEIEELLDVHPFIHHNSNLVRDLKKELIEAFNASQKESGIRKIVIAEKHNYDVYLRSTNNEEQTKKQNFSTLLESVAKYARATRKFYKTLEIISNYSVHFDSEQIESMGHKLYIENNFKLDKDKLLEVMNRYLKSGAKIGSFSEIKPEKLFDANFSKKSPKVSDYDDFEQKVYKEFEQINKKKYKIITEDGRQFENLSPGWKTSVILDIILGYDKDIAPIIIDQPEDNLATNYINKGLVEAIKKIKKIKQVILVSHNATIPMLADAQNIVLCKNVGGKLIIKSSPLEGKINDKSILDYIAEITDGGKPSIKKRVKKYNLKEFKETV